MNQEPIGLIAVDHGLIKGRQIDEVLDCQRNTNKKFGEIGVELGLLTEQKVGSLLQIQKYRVLTSITEALALAGQLSLDAGVRLLSDFVREHPEEIFVEHAEPVSS
jgi:hypothetical protein